MECGWLVEVDGGVGGDEVGKDSVSGKVKMEVMVENGGGGGFEKIDA